MRSARATESPAVTPEHIVDAAAGRGLRSEIDFLAMRANLALPPNVLANRWALA